MKYLETDIFKDMPISNKDIKFQSSKILIFRTIV